MGTEEPDYAEIIKLLKQLVIGMKSSTGPYQSRPTETVMKSSLETMRLIRSQEKDCSQGCKERIESKCSPLRDRVVALEGSYRDLKKRIFAEVEDLDTATKTRNGHVATLEGNVARLMATIFHSKDGEMKDRVEYVESWIDECEVRAEKEKDASRFRIGTILTIAGIVGAMSIGIVGLVLQIISMQ